MRRMPPSPCQPSARAHGGEEQRQRRRREHVVEGQGRVPAAPVRALPLAQVPALGPDHRPPGAVVAGQEGEGPEASRVDVLGDAPDRAAAHAEGAGQRLAQGAGVHEAPHRRRQPAAAREQADPPARHEPAERGTVGAEDAFGGQVAPDLVQAVDGRHLRAAVRGEEGGVDGAGGYAGHDGKVGVGDVFGDPPEEPDLIGGARPAARQHDGQIVGAAGSARAGRNRGHGAFSGGRRCSRIVRGGRCV